jgi:hypothetical protein
MPQKNPTDHRREATFLMFNARATTQDPDESKKTLLPFTIHYSLFPQVSFFEFRYTVRFL